MARTLFWPPGWLQSESTGTHTFSQFANVGLGANLTAFHFETKVSGGRLSVDALQGPMSWAGLIC